MFHTARALTTMFVQRWQAIRDDEGATIIEYALLVAMGFALATALVFAVTTVVSKSTNSIK